MITPAGDEAAVDGLSRRVIVADRGDAGVRLDRVLLRRLAGLPRLSRTQVQRWIVGGRVTVGARCVSRVAARVAVGDEIEVCFPTPAARARPAPEARPLTVLHEDDDLLVVDKPAGVVVHPSYRHASGTLLNALLGRAVPDGWTPRLAHRLDRQTSGVLVVAKHLEAHRALVRAWPTRAVRKHYLAIVIGKPPRPRGVIQLPLGRDPLDRRRVAVVHAGGRESVTRYQVLASSRGLRAGVSLVACELLTGRMHQVRVHLAAVGCPVVGDGAYGRSRLPRAADPRLAADVTALPRHALHAWRVDLRLPQRPAACFSAPLPPDLRRLLASAGLDADLLVDRHEAALREDAS
jgi:23S rRNA pseudouridine1911/1915/1917 synthase